MRQRLLRFVNLVGIWLLLVTPEQGPPVVGSDGEGRLILDEVEVPGRPFRAFMANSHWVGTVLQENPLSVKPDEPKPMLIDLKHI